PYLKYYRWFFNDGGGGTPNDTLSIGLSNGVTTVVLEEVTESSAGNSSWLPKTYKISDYLALTSAMLLTVETGDFTGSGHLVEAGIDMFQIEDFSVSVVNSNASCNGTCDAGAVAKALGGLSPLTYLWDDPSAQTTDTALGLCAGTHTATIIDAQGDTATSQITITEPLAIFLSTSTSALCDAQLSDVTVTASNGIAPYSYIWSDGNSQTTPTATSLSVGTFTVTVTDDDGCSNSVSITTTTNTVLSVGASSSNPLSCGGSDGTATALIGNGNSPFYIPLGRWTNPNYANGGWVGVWRIYSNCYRF
ncbi:MAG: PKD domain-containing protein, partial [Flavobacteriales bacterium]|nr:PKD domain-containing protein [Flavobacteriales bacterium]